MGAQLPSRHAGRRRAPMAEINVTPLVDVMLVLLIIFMVTAPMLTAGVHVNLPDSKAKQLDQDQKTLDVSIDAHGQVFVDRTPVPDDRLAAAFESRAARPGGAPPVQLNADGALDYARIMQVMGELNHAGLNRVALVTRPGAGR